MSVPSRTLCLTLRVENEDVWFLTERDWRQESFHNNITIGALWFSFVMHMTGAKWASQLALSKVL